MLLGGLLTKGLKAAVASKPYKKFRKEAMDKTAALYKKAPQMDPDRKSLKDKKFMREVLGNIPLGRFAELSDVASAVVFLASDQASMITGTSLLVDGGWTSK